MIHSIRDLQVGEMLSVSAHWLDPKVKPVFVSIPEIAPLVGRVQTVHGDLLGARDADAASAAVRSLAELADSLDDQHDHLARALNFLLLAARHFYLGIPTPNENAADAVERASHTLFPSGLTMIQSSYQSQAGNAAQVAKLAEGEFSTVLGAIRIDDKTTAKDLALLLGQAGQKLGEVENQKPAAAAEAEKEAIPPSEVRTRKRAWAKLAETILGNLDESSAPAQAIDAIRGPLLAAAEKATARRREKQAAKAKKDEPGQGG